MSLQKLTYLTYYALLLSFVGVKVIQVVFLSGVAITMGHSLAQLSVQKQQLEEKKYDYSLKLASAQTITTATNNLEGFQPIKDPYIIRVSNNVASR
jgi:hypothetical protein